MHIQCWESASKWPFHMPELDLAINIGLRKGSQYGLTWDMVDWKSRMLNISRAKNDEALHVPLNDAALAALKCEALVLMTRPRKRNSRTFTGMIYGTHLRAGCG